MAPRGFMLRSLPHNAWASVRLGIDLADHAGQPDRAAKPRHSFIVDVPRMTHGRTHKVKTDGEMPVRSGTNKEVVMGALPRPGPIASQGRTSGRAAIVVFSVVAAIILLAAPPAWAQTEPLNQKGLVPEHGSFSQVPWELCPGERLPGRRLITGVMLTSKRQASDDPSNASYSRRLLRVGKPL